MSELFLEIVNRSISAGWLILAVLLLRLLLKNAPKWVNVALWGMVGFRLVCPVSIQSVLSLIPSAQTISPTIMMDRTPTVSTGIPALNAVVNPIITESFTPDPAASANPLQIWIPVAAAVWVAGMVCLLIYTGVSYLRLRRRVSTAVLLRENIYQSEFVDSPFVLDILRPRIYIPYRLVGEASILAHERAHIARRDHWWKPLGFLLLTVYWFHPLMWVAYSLLCRDMEMACDERVIRELDENARADYSQALLAGSVRRNRIAACPLAFGEVGVKERVKSVLTYRKPGFWIVAVSAVLCLVLAVCFLTDPVRPSMEVLPEVHSHTYITYATVYENNTLHYSGDVAFQPERFAVTGDMKLMMHVDQFNVSYTGWIELGTLEPVKLTNLNSNELFTEPDIRVPGYWRDNVRAWRLMTENRGLYLLLQQNNGELYLACGDTNHGREKEPVIRWLFQLAIDVEGAYGVTAVSGENVVPLTVFPEGTAIGNYRNSVHWLTIDPGEDFVPFRTYQDGEEFRGHYLVFDAETYEELAYNVPSGLDPQTYLFQNADPTREYIVLMLTGEEGADQYCFGVRFPEYRDENMSTVTFLEPMVNIGGYVYVSTEEAMPAEMEPLSIIGKIHTIVDASEEPTQNGQANFDCVGADYARFEGGYAVLLNGEWVRFVQKPYPKYYLTVGEEGIAHIEVSAGSRGLDIFPDDMDVFQSGEVLYLDGLDGLRTLRGASITAKDGAGNDLFSVRIADSHYETEETIVCGDWIITVETE